MHSVIVEFGNREVRDPLGLLILARPIAKFSDKATKPKKEGEAGLKRLPSSIAGGKATAVTQLLGDALMRL
jgi:hypothetical protein